jgi:carbon-monoxide dehydrogenase large subunit/6-hydroxypseudooxynicotine dehydrogenase subunit gamma
MQREPTAISLVAMAMPNMPVRSHRPMSENVVNSIPTPAPPVAPRSFMESSPLGIVLAIIRPQIDPVKFVGAPIKRLEDPRLLVGGGRYVDDLVRPGMVHAVVVRSPHAHARLRRVDARRALALPGVLACVTGADLAGVPTIPIRQGGKPAHAAYLQPPLARDTVRYAGEPVAVVVATDRACAVDARELVDVDYDVLPALVDADEAERPGGPVLFAEGNVADSWTTVLGDVDAALGGAACVVRERFSVGRQTAAPMETRGLLGEWDAASERLTVWGTTKVPYFNRRTLATLLGLDEARIHFAEADAGGGFGARGEFYPEDFLVPYLARQLGRPVKWVEDRREHFLAINHSREQRWSVVAGADGHGRLLALDAVLVNVLGGYLRTHGVWAAALTASYLPGPYRWPSYRCRVSCVMTNKTPTGTVRSPGFYEGTFVRERVLDLLAARLGLDPAEIRRRNLPRPDETPYTVNSAAMAITEREADFAGEDFGAMFEHALKAGRYEAQLAACRERNAAGGDVRFGVGLAALVETSGTGPFESARVTLTSEGTITLAAGATSLGQGLPTTLAQVCADVLQITPDDVEVHLGDTDWMPHGVGSSASRSAVMAGSAVHEASARLRERIVALAAKRFEASPADVTLEHGAAFVRGVPDRRCSFREIAGLAGAPIQAEWRHETARAVGSFGVHLSVVGVDLATGQVHPETHFVLCDVGRAINPTIVEGQLRGAVVQGLGHATMEELVYDSSGQLLTGTFMDYALPTADHAPTVEVLVEETAAPSNPLGVKGAGESGTSGVGAAIANAVACAVGAAAAGHLPVTAPRVKAALGGAGS